MAYYDTPPGVGGQIDTSTGKILSGPSSGQNAQVYEGQQPTSSGADYPTYYNSSTGQVTVVEPGSIVTGSAPADQQNQQSTQSSSAPQQTQTMDTNAIQQYLVDTGRLTADQVNTGPGIYGPQTTAAVAKLQKDLGVAPTGRWDNQTQALAQKYQGIHGTTLGQQPPQTGADANAYINSFAQPTDPVFGAMTSSLSPIMSALTQTLQNINNPALTAVSLQQEYNQLAQENNLPQMQGQLLNYQRIMNGTEDDIRSEVTSAGGTATESQVLAMTAARNKVILKQYNALATNYQAAQTNVQNMMQYAATDQSTALQRQTASAGIVENMASIEAQMTQMGMTMQSTARSSAQWFIGKYGMQKYAQSVPDYMKPSMEQILGLNQGTLSDPEAQASIDASNPQRSALKIVGYDQDGNPIYGNIPRVSGGSSGGATTGGSSSGSFSGGGSSSGSAGGGTPAVADLRKQNYLEYGKLANLPDFQPNVELDQRAAQWLQAYISMGKDPAPSDVGLSSRSGTLHYMTNIKARANKLFTEATGQGLPDLNILQTNKKLIASNNAMLNSLRINIPTIRQNSSLLQQKITAGNINQHAPAINAVLDPFIYMMGNPDVASYLAQNQTLSNELGSLLALKGASGSGASTVHDKLVAAGLINKNSSARQEAAVVNTILQEAGNATDAITSSNRDLYLQIDPLQKDPQNPINLNIQDIVGQGGQDNGDGTYTLPGGTVVTP